jgi:hypothetical protein
LRKKIEVLLKEERKDFEKHGLKPPESAGMTMK